MKKLALALILALVIIMTFSTPVLANDGNGPGNMPDETADHLYYDVVGEEAGEGSLGFGSEQGRGIANWGGPLAFGVNVARHNIGYDIATLGETPDPWGPP